MPWDALICTSNAVRANVVKILETRIHELKIRLGITKVTLPNLPVIPLAIHTKDFEFTELSKIKNRNALGLNESEIVVLYMGRLSFHAKSHPLSMYQALEKVSIDTGKKIVLVECGWFANDAIQRAYENAASLACPSIRVIHLDGRNANNREVAWSCADIFCSLSDNIQETFGITPLEAMAAGLPLVVSDWDGYKDTVRHEVDGFRVSTCMPVNGLGEDLALRHAMNVDSYDMYCGHTSSLISVNIEETIHALTELVNSQELRKKMGESGRLQVKTKFDWSVVIPQYEALWASLDEQRQKSNELNTSDNGSTTGKWAARLDPFDSFAAYPTNRLSTETTLELVDIDPKVALNRAIKFASLEMVSYASYILPKESEVVLLIDGLKNGPQKAGKLIANISPKRKLHVFRSISWLMKMGVLKLSRN
jgi:glycosyltransferase involved in cell wall biosynthesis